jgi:hypothetical protein
MKKNRSTRLALAAALLTTLLAGCTIQYYATDRCPVCTTGGKGDPKNPVVTVSNGNITVDQEVLRFTKEQVNVTVTWRLPADGKLTFPDNGVVFERAAADEFVSCQRSKSLTEFSCVNKHTKPGLYKYGVNVNEDGKPLKPLDPQAWND